MGVKAHASARHKRRLSIRTTRPEYDLIAWASDRCGVPIHRFLVDAALAVAIPLRRALRVRKNLG